MKISVLFALIIIIISLGASLLQEGKICLLDLQQIDYFVDIKYNLKRSPCHWAVKLVMGGDYLLNTVTCSNALKATETTLIQLQIHKFEG